MCRAPLVHSAPASVNRRRLRFSGVAGKAETLITPPLESSNSTSRLLPSGELSASSTEAPAGSADRGSRRPRDEKDAPRSSAGRPVRLVAAKAVLPPQEG